MSGDNQITNQRSYRTDDETPIELTRRVRFPDDLSHHDDVTVNSDSANGKLPDIPSTRITIPEYRVKIKKKNGITTIFNRFTQKTSTYEQKLLDKMTLTIPAKNSLLVLGATKSGKTALLNEIASQYGQDCGYVHQRDLHLGYLTVRETLMFAARLQVPILKGHGVQTPQARVDEIITALSLEKCADTLVGDEQHRGVSGGERRRLSIGLELIRKDTALILMDEPTNGLDSESAEKVCLLTGSPKSDLVDIDLSEFYGENNQPPSTSLNTQHQQIICTLTQPGDQLLAHFDQLLVLHQGEVKYYGPMINPVETGLGMSKASTWLYNAQTLPTIHLEPEVHSKATSGNTKTKEIPELLSDDIKDTSRKSEHELVGFFTQLMTLLHRSWLRLVRQKDQEIGLVALQAVMSVFTGFFFFQLSYDPRGLQDRTSLVYYLLARIGVMGPRFIATFQIERKVFVVQRRKRYFGCLPYLLSETLIRLPLLFLECLLYNTLAYRLTGLYANGLSFMYLTLLCWLVYVAIYLMVIFVVFILPDLKLSSYLVPTIAIYYLTFCGFVIAFDRMNIVWKWFFYANPLWYAFQGALLNEFENTAYSSYLETWNVTGQPWNKLHCVLAILGLILLWFIGCYIALVLAPYIPTTDVSIARSQTIDDQGKFSIDEEVTERPNERSNGRPTVRPNERPMVKFADTIPNQTSNTPDNRLNPNAEECIFTWTDISYSIGKTKSEKQILHNISGQVKSGMLLALMGASGSGKTTLLDILSARKSIGKITGSITLTGNAIQNEGVNTQLGLETQPKMKTRSSDIEIRSDDSQVPVDRKLSRQSKLNIIKYSAYSEQTPHHLWSQTTFEEMQTVSLCKNGYSAPSQGVRGYAPSQGVRGYAPSQGMRGSVPSQGVRGSAPSQGVRGSTQRELLVILKMFGLTAIAGRPINDELTDEEKKRISIAVQLAAKSKLLFLDEPLTGLDTLSAITIMDELLKLTQQGLGIICSIHQPSVQIFEKFTDLLLLTPNGHLSYFGPRVRVNMALDLMVQSRQPLQLLDLETGPMDDQPEIKGSYIEEISRTNRKEPQQNNNPNGNPDRNANGNSNGNTNGNANGNSNYLLSWWEQVKLNMKRMTRTIIRDVWGMEISIGLTIGLALFFGTALFQRPNDQLGIHEKFAAIYFVTAHCGLKSFAYIIMIFAERAYYIRERKSKMYTASAFVVSKLITQTPEILMNSILFAVIFYWLVGLRAGFGYFIFFTAALFFLELCIISFAQIVSAWSNDLMVATAIYGITLNIFMITTGFMRFAADIPVYFKWSYWISFFHWFLDAGIINEFNGATIDCTSSQLVNGTCPITTGAQVLDIFGLNPVFKFIDLGALLGFYVIFSVLVIIGYSRLHRTT